jgi:acyl-CoA synthetase (AMP-forming)/AMP-acid ligase II
MFVCFRLGAVWVPINFRQVPSEVAYLAAASGATALICEDVFPEHAAAVREQCADLRIVVAIGEAAFGESYERLVEQHAGSPYEAADVEYDDPCWFFYTSGTTGRPKAAVLTHGQTASVITNHLCDLMSGTTPEDASLVVAPLSHGAGIRQLVQTARAAKTVLLSSRSLDAEEVWRLVAQWRITNMFTVPTILKMLVEHSAVHQFDHSSLRYVIYAGAPMYRADQRTALSALGKVLVQYYGLSEVTGNITVLPPAMHDTGDIGEASGIGTCGYERTGMQVSIQDSTGHEVLPGETGEICVCGPAVFAGYYNNPEANAAAFRNGWFRTGDLGHLDAAGFLYITGRASDMYISGGSNIYPREIEEKLLEHPAIAEVAVLGVPDARWGEVGVAVCVLRQDATADGQGLLEWLAGRMARYKIPKAVHFWDELPKSAYGKITKKAVRERLSSEV